MNRINAMYQDYLLIKRKKIIKVVTYIMIPIIVFALIMLYFILEEPRQVYKTLFYISLGLIGTGLLNIALSFLILTDKPMYNIVINEIIKDMNMNEQRFLEYEPFIKEKEIFNLSGLYPRSALKSTKFKLTMNTDHHSQVQLFFTELFTQSNNSRVVYFKGLYMVFDTLNQDIFQIRRKGKPRHKEIKLIKEEREDKLKFYSQGKPIKETYLLLFESLENQYGKVDIAGAKDQIHVALSNFMKISIEKEINDSVYKKYYDMILSLIKLTDEISEKIAY
ncbi:MAG: hypothetical protein AB7E09_06665 [Candidatus Izemoplasmatales bacterium]